ncbi:hypothetical protein D6C86_02609 [Aureobasidium pullulans]|uniref:Extracellular membrane protein CFEM domain-containing protein n=1 Tax=Aureobasidium pullulans TaxID=5580 RepID=A0A4V6TIB4_AURPU|nr:hypothetical protein D6C94_01657 [Aureobasidium pullulans]THZ47301.1 hypothetical protein D6C87_01542 [Aureobasidium pullulans]THZ64287.1 hypothetical protein D6C86_02609 [Aureobasidium pullulans]
MRSFVPVLIGLATVAVAQNSTVDCTTSFVACYDFNTSNDNTCSSKASACKDACSTKQSNCLSSGTSSELCASRYDDCVGATSTSNLEVSCLAAVIPCYASASHDESNACDSKITNCKQTCSSILDICNSTGNDNSELCQKKYSACLGSNNATAPSTSCIAQGEQAYLDNAADNTAASFTATCKQTCGVLKDACMTSGDDSQCQSSYEQCLGVGLTESSVHCVAEVEALIQSGTSDQDVESSNAQCKDFCARGYDTCNSANDSANNATCLSWYSSCVGAKDLPTLTSSCVSNSEASYLNGTSGDNAQDADLATCKSQCGYLYSTCLSSGDESVKEGCLSFYSECKNQCTRSYSACTSSGDPSVTAQCSSQYQSCLGSSKLEKPKVDCVAENDACYLSGKFTDAECDAKNAVCKTSQDTCLSGNSSSVVEGCNTHYSQCLGSADVTPVSPVSCVEIATDCFLSGDDTCLSSGDESVKPACQKHYDTCLGATPEAEKAASSINCVQRYTSCFSSGIEENTCSAANADCKNTCSQLLDSCNSSGDNSTASQCQGVYNSCLGSIATSLVDYKPLDCAGRSKLCASNGTASNECDRENASCTNACATTLDTCLVSGSSDTAACNHLYMMCLDSSSYTVTSIPASLKPTSSRASLSIIPSANATTKATGISAALTTGPASGAISTGGAFVSGPYNNGSSSTADAQSGAVSVATSTESTVYVTDVVKTTVTTCPVGFTLTTAGSTTVLATPSVITTSVTVKSTISTTVAHTVTVPAAGNNAIPSSKATPSVESTVYVTDVVKSTVTTCPVGQTVTASGSTTVLTAPSVMTSQITVKSTVSTVITHTAVVPQSSPVSPEQTTPASFAGHVAVPSTVTLYSTKEVTITSCAADVTNCPAKVSTTLFPTAITVTSVWSRTQSTSAASSPAGSAPAGSAPAGSAPAGSAPAGSSPVSPETTSAPVTVPSTMFYYSTAVVTVTSCAEGVENCPARSTVVKTSVVPTGYAVTSVISSAWTPEAYTSPSAGVPENSAPVASVPVSSAPVAAVPTTAPFAVNNSTMMSVGPTGTGMVGTGSGSKATSTFSPSQYTGAANKAGAAGLAGVAAFAAFLL